MTPSVRSWNTSKEGFLGFAGYKAGMTHLLIRDDRKNALNKGQDISVPATVIECPPMRIASLRLYIPYGYGEKIAQEIFFKPEKELIKKTRSGPPQDPSALDSITPSDFSNITITIYTQPKHTTIGKKKPDLFELHLGGNTEAKLTFAKQHINKDIHISDVFPENSTVDLHAVTKGKGFQGPVKRFGIALKSHKSEKGQRNPGSLGSWCGQGHMMYRVAHAGQMGFHLRTQYNNLLLKTGSDPKDVNPKGGFLHYGNVKNNYILVKGSVPGPKSRCILLTHPIRNTKLEPIGEIEYISTRSKQGR